MFARVAPPTPPHELDSPAFRPTPSHPTTCSAVLGGRSAHQGFVATASRVVRIFNLPKDASSHLATLFHPRTLHAPLTLWALREEYGGPAPGDEDSVWAVFKSHAEAAAALSLSGGSVSVATALELDLEPFQKLRKLDLRRHSVPTLTAPLSLSHRRANLSSPVASSHHRLAELERLGLPLRASHSVSDLRSRGLDLNVTGEDCGFTLSSNPPNPRNSFRQGDWICPSLNCAAHNFMRNLVCIGCGSPRPNASSSSSSSNSSLTVPWSRVASSPRFGTVSQSSEHLSSASQPRPIHSSTDFMDRRSSYAPSPPMLSPQRALPKMPSLPSFSNGRAFSPSISTDASFSPTAPSFSPNNYPFSPTHTSFSQSSQPALSSPSSNLNLNSVAAAAVALKLPSILTPSGRAFSIGGKVQNVSGNPLAPCVLYWPDNEPFPSQGQIRPPGNVGAQPPPILNTGNKGPLEQQPGDWVCKTCDYLNWRRRKVCQTCFPYAEGNTDGVAAGVQAERITMLAQVLAASQPQTAAQSQPGVYSHSIPTPPNDTSDVLDVRSPYTAQRSSSPFYSTANSPYSRAISSSPESEYWSPTRTRFTASLLPSPATPPLSVGSGSSSPQSVQGPTLRNSSSSSSLSFAGGPSIWALRKEEVDA